jgi:hypothetical protein
VKSSTALPRAKIIIELGDATTTPSGHTHRSATNHRRPRPRSGLHCADRLHHHLRR